MYCSNCGKEIDDNAKFCQNCGDRIKQSEKFLDMRKYSIIILMIILAPLSIAALEIFAIYRFVKKQKPIFKFKEFTEFFYMFMGWLIGVSCIIDGIVVPISKMGLNYIGGFLLCLFGLLCIPPINKKIDSLLKERTDKKKIKIITGIVLFLLIPIVGINEANNKDNAESITNTKKTESAIKKDIKIFNKPSTQSKIHKAPIEDGAIWLLPTQEGQGYDKTIARYGVTGIKKINSLMPKAANIVALNQACDAIVQVDASDNRSTSGNIVMYVDCKNGQRFYLSEKEITSNTSVQSEKEKLIKLMPSHISICEAKIKNSLNYPSTYKKLISKTGFETKEMVNDIVVGFKAKNAFNLELEYEARCMINSNSEISGFGIKEER